MGNTNEPPRGPPSTELLELELKVAADDDPLMQRHDLKQSQESLAQFRRFAHEHPEIEERSAFFCTRKLNFDLSEEITVVYGNSYKRTYSTWGHAGVPLRYRVPADTYPEGAWTHWAEWPRRCPGWFNVDMQPINRPAFKRTQSLAPYRKRTQPIARLIGDLPAVVASRRLGLYGDDQERRLAQCTSIYWDPRIPQLDGAPRVPPLSGAGEAEDDEDVASDAGFTPGFTPPTAVHWLGCGYAGSLCPKREDFDPLALGMYAGPRLPPWALLAAQVAAGAPGDSPSSKGGEGGGEEGDGGVADLSVTGMCRSTEFELPAELRSLNKEELYRLALAEESHPRRCEDPDDDEDVPLTELEWSAPWRHPLGTIVWVRMRGFSWWPALVCQPYVNDRDIARQRLAGNLFVKFFGWTKEDFYFTNSPDEALSWEDGLALGLLEKRVVRKSHDRMLQTAKREAIAAIAARAPLGKPPLPPPPWWQVRFAGDLAGYLATEPGEEEGGEGEGGEGEGGEGGEGGGEGGEGGEGGGEGGGAGAVDETRRLESLRSSRRLARVDASAAEAAEAAEGMVAGDGGRARRSASRQLPVRSRDRGREALAVYEAAQAEHKGRSPEAKRAWEAAERAACEQMARETKKRGPLGSDTDGWREWLDSGLAWVTSTLPPDDSLPPDDALPTPPALQAHLPAADAASPPGRRPGQVKRRKEGSFKEEAEAAGVHAAPSATPPAKRRPERTLRTAADEPKRPNSRAVGALAATSKPTALAASNFTTALTATSEPSTVASPSISTVLSASTITTTLSTALSTSTIAAPVAATSEPSVVAPPYLSTTETAATLPATLATLPATVATTAISATVAASTLSTALSTSTIAAPVAAAAPATPFAAAAPATPLAAHATGPAAVRAVQKRGRGRPADANPKKGALKQRRYEERKAAAKALAAAAAKALAAAAAVTPPHPCHARHTVGTPAMGGGTGGSGMHAAQAMQQMALMQQQLMRQQQMMGGAMPSGGMGVGMGDGGMGGGMGGHLTNMGTMPGSFGLGAPLGHASLSHGMHLSMASNGGVPPSAAGNHASASFHLLLQPSAPIMALPPLWMFPNMGEMLPDNQFLGAIPVGAASAFWGAVTGACNACSLPHIPALNSAMLSSGGAGAYPPYGGSASAFGGSSVPSATGSSAGLAAVAAAASANASFMGRGMPGMPGAVNDGAGARKPYGVNGGWSGASSYDVNRARYPASAATGKGKGAVFGRGADYSKSFSKGGPNFDGFVSAHHGATDTMRMPAVDQVTLHKPDASARLGITLINSDETHAPRGPTAPVITAPAPGCHAADSGRITTNQLLIAVNGQRVHSHEEATALLRNAMGNVALTLTASGGGSGGLVPLIGGGAVVDDVLGEAAASLGPTVAADGGKGGERGEVDVHTSEDTAGSGGRGGAADGVVHGLYGTGAVSGAGGKGGEGGKGGKGEAAAVAGGKGSESAGSALAGKAGGAGAGGGGGGGGAVDSDDPFAGLFSGIAPPPATSPSVPRRVSLIAPPATSPSVPRRVSLDRPAQQQEARFNQTVEGALGTAHTSLGETGVEPTHVDKQLADACASYLRANWLADGTCAVGKHQLRGYSMYGKVLGVHDGEQQRTHTLLLTPATLPSVRAHLAGFARMEEELSSWLNRRFGTLVELVFAHGLRQSPATLSSTGFDVHQVSASECLGVTSECL